MGKIHENTNSSLAMSRGSVRSGWSSATAPERTSGRSPPQPECGGALRETNKYQMTYPRANFSPNAPNITNHRKSPQMSEGIRFGHSLFQAGSLFPMFRKANTGNIHVGIPVWQLKARNVLLLAGLNKIACSEPRIHPLPELGQLGLGAFLS